MRKMLWRRFGEERAVEYVVFECGVLIISLEYYEQHCITHSYHYTLEYYELLFVFVKTVHSNVTKYSNTTLETQVLPRYLAICLEDVNDEDTLIVWEASCPEEILSLAPESVRSVRTRSARI